MTLRESWDAHADEWIRWVRTPGHDSYDQFHGSSFLELVPPPGRLTVDIGGGEGRLGRDLTRLGHRVVVFDGSPSLARACASHELPVAVCVADASFTPARSACADLVVAFMSLHDVDDLDAVVAEIARLLIPGGRLCMAIVHPLNSAGSFEGDHDDAEAPFVVRGSYVVPFRYHDEIERDGLTMTFHSIHRPLESYTRALQSSGFVIEAMQEATDPSEGNRWRRLPMFLDLRARRL